MTFVLRLDTARVSFTATGRRHTASAHEPPGNQTGAHLSGIAQWEEMVREREARRVQLRCTQQTPGTKSGQRSQHPRLDRPAGPEWEPVSDLQGYQTSRLSSLLPPSLPRPTQLGRTQPRWP